MSALPRSSHFAQYPLSWRRRHVTDLHGLGAQRQRGLESSAVTMMQLEQRLAGRHSLTARDEGPDPNRVVDRIPDLRTSAPSALLRALSLPRAWRR
jgi:hypothetical protein